MQDVSFPPECEEGMKQYLKAPVIGQWLGEREHIRRLPMEGGKVISPLVAIEHRLGREENINPLLSKCAIKNHVIDFRHIEASYMQLFRRRVVRIIEVA